MKTCIFDLDGTLTDSMDSLVHSVNLTLGEMELGTITKEQCTAFVGYGARTLLVKSLKAVGDTEAQRIDEAMEVYDRVFEANCIHLVKPYSGITELLDELHRRGLKLAVLSNKPHKQAVKVVTTIFGDDTFEVIQGRDSGFAKKPEGESVLGILRQLGGEKGECLYIGDSEVDVETGRNAGVLTLAASWGSRTVEELEAAGAEHIIYKAEEVLDFV